jgi:predicted HicB family RNase H-like nuclease
MADGHPGRPKKREGRLEPISTNVRPEVYDRLWREAQRSGVSLAELVRKRLEEAPQHDA